MSDEFLKNEELRAEFGAAMQSWFRGRKLLPILKRIEASKATEFIPDVSSLLLDKNSDIARAAAQVSTSLVQAIPISALVAFDVEARRYWNYWRDGQIGPSRWQSFRDSCCWGGFAIMASHPSGFVRQAAVEELVRLDIDDSLPFLLLRTTDWIAPVRDEARRGVKSKLTPEYSAALAKCLPVAFRLREMRRHRPTDLLDEMERIAASATDFVSVDFGANLSPAFYRYRFGLSLAHSLLSQEQIIEAATKNPDAGLRILVCDWINEKSMSDQTRDKYADLLFSDRSARVRLRAFWRIGNAAPERYQNQIERALMDQNAAVQDTARGAWRMLLHRNALAFYQQKSTTAKKSKDRVAVLRGLRAESSAADEMLVRPWLEKGTAKVRCEALRTLIEWKVSDADVLMQRGLLSQNSSYAKEAARLLLKHANLLSPSLVMELLDKPAHPESYKIAIHLLVRMSKWSSLPLILHAYAMPACRDQAQVAFTEWNKNYNRVQIAPTKLEAEAALNTFKEMANLPLANHKELIGILSILKEVAG